MDAAASEAFVVERVALDEGFRRRHQDE